MNDVLRPSAAQLAWQRAGLGVFFHFGLNTFAGVEWSDGTLSPEVFDPTDFDADQWVEVAAGLGAAYVVLTAKHHDGFCLWPTKTTDYSVASSPWRDGRGDVVAEVAAACRRRRVGFGVYLSPWDRYAPEYADADAYDAVYAAQLTELMTGYGDLTEVWFDGAGSDGRVYDWPRYMRIVQQHQPDAMIFNMGAPTIRWVGNEDGLAADPVEYVTDALALNQYVTGADALAERIYAPPECDVSIRRGWFWHPDDEPKSVAHLMAIHLQSIGMGAGLLLNLPPDTSGRIDPRDAERVRELRAELDRRFSAPVRADVEERSPGQWAVRLPAEVEVGQIELREALEHGQRITRHTIEVDERAIVEAKTVGVRRIHTIDPIALSSFRVAIDEGAQLDAVIVYPANPDLVRPELPEGYEASTDPPDPVTGLVSH
ncbi:alpha-L-fucosidase [Microbacterium sp.]|uniref:alpha-L-fucosidase n=1 Tax=Microbacterium sp. TaxID=51671 RepID=UPI0028119893|nr:alpha-L-fucosidase [Microbacterium sp.]